MTSVFRGGLHGEVNPRKAASHDGEKKHPWRQDFDSSIEERKIEVAETNEAQKQDPAQGAVQLEGRPSQPSHQEVAEQTATKQEVSTMSADTSNLPKTSGQLAKVFGNLTNDPRITNLLMLVIIAVGMGVHESIQTQVCSL